MARGTSCQAEDGLERGWWKVSAAIAVVTVAYVALLIWLPQWPGTILLGVGIAAFGVAMYFNPRYRYHRMAAACLAMAVSGSVLPDIEGAIQLGPDTFGALAVENAQTSGTCFLVAAIVFVVLDFLSRRQGRGFGGSRAAGVRALTKGDRSPVAGGGQTVIEGDVYGDVIVGDRGRKVARSAETGGRVAVTRVHSLPPPLADFTGRKGDVEELLGALSEGGATICGVGGMGGVGKTELAIVVAHRLADRYPAGQLFLNLRGVDLQGRRAKRPEEVIGEVIRAFQPEAQLSEEIEELLARYRSVLHGRQALLVLDNAADRQQVERLIPPERNGLLVTSRRDFTLPGLYRKNLDQMPPDDARALLLRICLRIDAVADELAKLCGYLPLALRVAARTLEETPELTPREYIGRLGDERRRVREWSEVDATISLSEGQLSKELRGRFRILAVFAESFARGGAAAVWSVGEDEAGEALAELRRYTLLQWNQTARRYHLHDLVRLYADGRLQDADRLPARGRHAEHYRQVLAEADEAYMKGGDEALAGLAGFDLERANIEAGFEWCRSRVETDDEAAKLCSAYADAGAYCLALRQHPREQAGWLEAALGAARRLKDRKREAIHAGNLGLIYQTRGDLDQAETMHRKSLEINEKLGRLEGMATTYGNLGAIYQTRGDLDQAEAMHRKSLEIERKLGRLEGVADDYGNLGLIYKTRGDLEQAEAMLRKSLEISEKLGRLEGMANQYGNLGVVYKTRGDPAEARRLWGQAVELFEKIGMPHMVDKVQGLIDKLEGQRK